MRTTIPVGAFYRSRRSALAPVFYVENEAAADEVTTGGGGSTRSDGVVTQVS